eukprot:TRINITY_DN467_c0_g1_i1.p1 TRINITY_DN467_c0_g1~~TRINITY_DN467_c0_g1_i1.p1  ORF type:complete len:535 (+),score=115.34 TRINITY_DN467_c0_g1_i1:1563-3167(+)
MVGAVWVGYNTYAVNFLEQQVQVFEKDIASLDKELQKKEQIKGVIAERVHKLEHSHCEMGAHTSPVHINATDATDVCERLYTEGLMQVENRTKLAKEAKIAQELCDLSTLQNPPRILQPKAATQLEFAQRQTIWKRAVEEHILQQTLLHQQEEMRHCEKKTVVTPRSQQIIQNKGDYEGPVSGWTNHFVHYIKNKTPSCPQLEHSPNINEGSRQLQRSTSVFERLSPRKKAEEKPAEDTNDAKPEDSANQETKAPTKEDGGRPKGQRIDVGEVVNRILKRSEEMQRKAQRKLEVEKKKAECTFSPTLTPRSAEIVNTTGRKPLFVGHRPYTPPAPSPPKGGLKPAEFERTQRLFLERQQRTVESRQRRLEKVKAKMDVEHQQSCTFAPTVNSHSCEIFAHKFDTTNSPGKQLSSPSQTYFTEAFANSDTEPNSEVTDGWQAATPLFGSSLQALAAEPDGDEDGMESPSSDRQETVGSTSPVATYEQYLAAAAEQLMNTSSATKPPAAAFARVAEMLKAVSPEAAADALLLAQKL